MGSQRVEHDRVTFTFTLWRRYKACRDRPSLGLQYFMLFDLISLHLPQQCRRVPYSLHPLPHLWFVEFWQWPFWLVWSDILLQFCICISLMTVMFSIFSCLLAIFMSSLEKCLFRSSAHFLIELFVFLMLSCMSCLYILKINPFSVSLFATIFSHSEGFLFILFIVSFAVQKLLRFIRS